jgi:hypothetical protein
MGKEAATMEESRGIGPSALPALANQYRYMLRALNELRQRQHGGAQTTLTYKLDPGEPGVLRSAAPAQSGAAVVSQEQANIRRLSAEARARGEDVVSVNVSYTADVVDGKLALRAGHTEIASLPRVQRNAAAAVYEANREAALSLGNLDLSDDAGLRSLNGGLTPETP